MRRWLAAAGIAGVCAVAAAPAEGGGGCTPGVQMVRGVRARVFCGPATATASSAGRTYRFGQGACERGAGWFTVNVGVASLEPGKAHRLTYFGVTVGRTPGSALPPAAKDGTYSGGTVAITVAGRGIVVGQPKVTLTGGRRAGTFAGRALGGGRVTGSFRCG